MKKLYTPFIILSLIPTLMFSQTNTFPSSGNVGIGTTTPSKNLSVNGTIITDTLLFPDGTFQTTAAHDSVQLLKVGKNSLVITEKGIIRDDGELRIQTADTQTVIRCFISPATTSGSPGTINCDSSTVIFSPNNHNTVMNVGNTGKVGIGTFSPSEKLTVEGTIYSTTGGFKFPDNTVQTSASAPFNSNPTFNTVTVTNKIITPRITSFAGDSIIHFGDSSISVNYASNTVTWTPGFLSRQGLAIGNGGSEGIGLNSLALGTFAKTIQQNSIAMGTWVVSNAPNAITIGEGAIGSAVLSNATPNSLMIGFNSNIPTLTVRQANGVGTTGNVGIATTTPYKKLTVNGDVSLANYCVSPCPGNQGDGFSGLEILGNNQVPTRRGISLDPDPNGSLNFYINVNQNPSAFNFKDGNANTTLMTIDGKSSAVGIGTTNVGTGYKLYVNGKIRAKEVVVETGWNDWVLKSNYKLQPLPERKDIIFENSRMPYMQSEQEVKENGANLGSNLSGLQHNVEDIYLYIFQLNDRIEKLEKENVELKKQIGE